MARADLPQERRLRGTDVGQGLARLGIRIKDNEVDGMAVFERDAHLGFGLEPADAAAVSGSRVDDHPRPPVFALGGSALGRANANQCVVDRAFERAAVDHDVVIEHENWLKSFLLALDIGITAPAERVHEQDQPL